MSTQVYDRARIQRRVGVVLMSSITPTSAAMSAGFAAAAVLAEELTGSESLTGLAASSLSVGSVAAAVPLARRMARLGRRIGLVTGWLIGALGGLCAFISAVAGWYPMLVVGMIAIGAGHATSLSSRFAAADLATEERRARAIGFQVWATTIGAVAGPTIALGPASAVAEWTGLHELAGPFLLCAMLFAGGASVTHLWLRPDPLQVLGTIGERAPTRTPLRTVLSRIVASPAARLAVLAMLVSQAVMVGVMTMTPLHLKNSGHETKIIGFVISLHIIGMYAFSPLVAWLVGRLGPYLMTAAAGLILAVGGEVAAHTEPQDSTGMYVGLLLIGLGWSFALISGSTLLTNSFPADQRVEIQGAADFLMAGGGAAAGTSAGVIVSWTNFEFLSHWSGLAALLLVAAAAGGWLSARPARLATT